MTNDRIKEIRKLLDLYYQGLTTPVEERRLSGLFAEEESLPADLVVDRQLFSNLDTEIPSGIATKIEEALETEFRASRVKVASRFRR